MSETATEAGSTGTAGERMSTAALWHDGLWRENPALVKLLGLCPLLAVSNSVVNGLALGLATLVTVLLSSTLVSSLRHRLPGPVRIPLFVTVIATAVTALELLIAAWRPALHASLGLFLPLIVTNCMILGRAEAFASRRPLRQAVIDALAMGTGFLAVLVVLGALRELLAQGTLLANAAWLFGTGVEGWQIGWFDRDAGLLLAALPPGAFMALGLLLAIARLFGSRRR